MDGDKKSPESAEPEPQPTRQTAEEEADAASRPEDESASGGEPHESAPAKEREAASAVEGAVGEVQEESRSEEAPAYTVYCIRCGAAMLFRDQFCHACGWKAGVEPPPPPPPRVVSNPSPHNRLTVLLLCVLLGWLGVHRFYVGKVGTGLLWLFTGGVFVVGAVYDLVLIATGEFRDSEEKRIVRWN